MGDIGPYSHIRLYWNMDLGDLWWLSFSLFNLRSDLYRKPKASLFAGKFLKDSVQVFLGLITRTSKTPLYGKVLYRFCIV